jgi:Domain of Unknown Function (DUF928)
MMAWLKEFARTRILTLALALVIVSFLLFPLFPISQNDGVTRWLTPVAYAQGGVLAPFRNLLVRTGLYTPPRRGTAPSGRRVGGAGRGPICALAESEQSNQVNALMPFQAINEGNEQETQQSEAGADTELVGGLTIAAQPTFWFYVPYISTEKFPKRVARFVLLDEDDRPVWNELMNVELRDHPQLVEYPLPYALETGKLYNWYFSVICDADKLSRNSTVRGWVQRTEPPLDLQRNLREAPYFEQYLAYANNDLWFEMVSSLVNIRRSFPFANQDNWSILLAHLQIPESNQFDILESVVLTEREVVNGSQLPANM